MSTSTDTGRSAGVATPAERSSSVRRLLLVSAFALAVQTSLTDYGTRVPGAGVWWFLLGVLLLWLVDSRRSRLARGLVVVSSLLGAVLHGTAVPEDGSAAVLAVAYLAQAVPLLAGPVRRHVGAS